MGAVHGAATDHSRREVQDSTSLNQSQVENDHSIARDCLKREIRKPGRYVDSKELTAYAFIVATEIPEGTKPSTYTEAIPCPNSSSWLLAMQEEMDSLHKNQT